MAHRNNSFPEARIHSFRMERFPAMLKRHCLFLPIYTLLITGVISFSAGLPWDKAPEQWTLSDVFRILQDSPWSPSRFSIESNYTQRRTDSQSGVVGDAVVNTRNTAVVPA
jgi:hypothetical protein